MESLFGCVCSIKVRPWQGGKAPAADKRHITDPAEVNSLLVCPTAVLRLNKDSPDGIKTRNEITEP